MGRTRRNQKMVVIGTSFPPPLAVAAPSQSLSSRPPRKHHAPSLTHISDSILTPIFSIPNIKFPRSSKTKRRTVALEAQSSSRDPEDSGFLDENGVVEDMDGYLNYLSLEYDSVWDTKPSWCQPWTITLTGVSVIGFSWIIFKSVVITTTASLLIAAWWYIFLYSYPKEYSNMIAERRNKVTSGVEDTFGMRKSQ